MWATDGRLLYAPDRAMVGRRMPISHSLRQAIEGRIAFEYGELGAEENLNERALGIPLVEIYAPIVRETSGEVVAVVEFYAIASALEAELRRSRAESWLIVSVIALFVLSAIVALVSGDGATIARQEKALQGRVAQLSRLLVHNEELRQNLLEARRGAVETNERVLRRIGADLHDGPAQLLGLALLRLDNLTPLEPGPGDAATLAEIEKIRAVLNSTLTEIRVLSSGIAPPALERVEAADAIEMAVANHEQHTGTRVERGRRDAARRPAGAAQDLSLPLHAGGPDQRLPPRQGLRPARARRRRGRPALPRGERRRARHRGGRHALHPPRTRPRRAARPGGIARRRLHRPLGARAVHHHPLRILARTSKGCAMTDAIRIAVVDDHPLFLEGVVHTLQRSGRFHIVAQGTTADDAIAIARRDGPSVILLDVSMPGGGSPRRARWARSARRCAA